MGAIVTGAVIGLALFLFGLFQIRKLRASRSWLVASGMVREVSVERRAASDEDDSDSYTPVITYGFGVGGRPYVGTRIRFDTKSFSSQGAARASVAGFRPGTAVTVFYNPANPADCVLERKNSGGYVLMAVGGVMLLSVIVAALR